MAMFEIVCSISLPMFISGGWRLHEQIRVRVSLPWFNVSSRVRCPATHVRRKSDVMRLLLIQMEALFD
jgi:hypothetical protein